MNDTVRSCNNDLSIIACLIKTFLIRGGRGTPDDRKLLRKAVKKGGRQAGPAGHKKGKGKGKILVFGGREDVSMTTSGKAYNAIARGGV